MSIGALLVAGVGLSSGIVLFENDYAMLTLVAVMLTASFFAHEIAHKITAQRQGFWAEFRLTLMGAIVTLISIISPFFKIISPGAVIVQGYTDAKKMGKTSIAGPATNIVLSAVFLPLAFLFPSYSLIFTLGSAYNAWIALFNLIPFGMLDGFKIFKWDRGIWTLGFVSSLALTVATYWLLLY